MEPNTLASHDAAGRGPERAAPPQSPLSPPPPAPRRAFEASPGHLAVDPRAGVATTSRPGAPARTPNGAGTNGHAHSAARPAGIAAPRRGDSPVATLGLQSVVGTVY